jgi:signal transduction histidine kinase
MEAQEELIDRSNRLSETIEIIMNEKLELIRWVNLLSIVAGLLLAGLFYFSLGKMIIHPVKRLKQATQLFTEGNRTVRADLQSDDELGNLSSTFNEFIVTVTRQEEELRLRFLEAMKNNQELERASKMKSQFLARMSHELRAPMNSIIGYSEVLLDELDGELNEEQKTDVRSVLKASEHLLRLINEILDLSKIEAGHMKVVLEAVRIRDVIRDVEATAEPLLRAKSLSWTVYGIEEDVTVRADRDRLRQMLLNLVSNAIKFTEKGGLTLRIEKDETKGIIEVEDTGIGIPEGEVERVFEEFHQVDGASNRRHGGTGLGLAIVRKFAELMNGRVSCRSAVEVGSVFRMELPLFTYRPDEGEENKTEVEE